MKFWRNQQFVARLPEQQMIGTLFSKSATPAVIITGLGGMGKTQLCVEFALRYGSCFQGGVFWISFANRYLILNEIAECGELGCLGLFTHDMGLSVREKALLVLSAWCSPLPRLLIFDNCEDEELLEYWLPPRGGSRVLITSRKEVWQHSSRWMVHALPPLSREESIQFLSGFRIDLAGDREGLSQLAGEVGDLPLALHLAGSYLEDAGPTLLLGAYLDQLRRTLPLRHISLRKDRHFPTYHEGHVERTFLLSFSRLTSEDLDLEARAVLARCSVCAPSELIPRWLLLRSYSRAVRVPDREAFANAVNRLRSLGLLQQSPNDGALRIHKLLSDFTQLIERADHIDRARCAVEDVMRDSLCAASITKDFSSIRDADPHYVHIADTAIPRYLHAHATEPAQSLLYWLQQLLIERHAYDKLASSYELMFRGDHSAIQAQTQVNYAVALCFVGKLEEALANFVSAQAFYAGRGQSQECSVIEGEIANCCSLLGRNRQAQHHYLRAFRAARHNEDEFDRLKVAFNLSTFLFRQGWIGRSLKLSTHVAEKCSLRVAHSWLRMRFYADNQSALGHWVRGEFEAGRKLCESIEPLSLRLADKLCVVNHLHTKALHFDAIGEDGAALSCFEAALTQARELRIPSILANALHSLAESLADKEKYREARPLASEAAEIALSLKSGERIAWCLGTLSRISLACGDLQSASTAAATAARHYSALESAEIFFVVGAIAVRRRRIRSARWWFQKARKESEAMIIRDRQNIRCLCVAALSDEGLNALGIEEKYRTSASDLSEITRTWPGVTQHVNAMRALVH